MLPRLSPNIFKNDVNYFYTWHIERNWKFPLEWNYPFLPMPKIWALRFGIISYSLYENISMKWLRRICNQLLHRWAKNKIMPYYYAKLFEGFTLVFMPIAYRTENYSIVFKKKMIWPSSFSRKWKYKKSFCTNVNFVHIKLRLYYLGYKWKSTRFKSSFKKSHIHKMYEQSQNQYRFLSNTISADEIFFWAWTVILNTVKPDKILKSFRLLWIDSLFIIRNFIKQPY